MPGNPVKFRKISWFLRDYFIMSCTLLSSRSVQKKNTKSLSKAATSQRESQRFYVLGGNGDLEIRSKPPASDARALQAELFVGTLTYYQVHGINQKNNPYHV